VVSISTPYGDLKMNLTTESLHTKFEELLKAVRGTSDLPEGLLDNMIRLARPASSDAQRYALAIKQRLRQSVLMNASEGNGPLAVANMERECDRLKRSQFRFLPQLLAMLEPLAFTYVPPPSSFVPKSSSEHRTFSTSIPESSLNGALPYEGNNIGGISPVSSVDMQALLDRERVWITADAELKILRDLLYVFQGISSRHIRYDSRSDSYVVDPSLQLSPGATDTVLVMCELGWLYNKVKNYTANIEAKGSERGLVAQAFVFALETELHDYYRLLAVLEQELARKVRAVERGSSASGSARNIDVKTLTTNSDMAERNGFAVGGNSCGVPHMGGDITTHIDAAAAESVKDGEGLSLLQLRAWMLEPTERMILMAKLADGAGPLIGGALASRLHGYCRHGDPGIASFVQRIMHSVCTPLYSMLVRWVTHGELVDPHKEFFVGIKVGVSEHAMWQDMYFLRQSMLPSFLSLALAKKVLVIGKSINFIRACAQRMVSSHHRKAAKAEMVIKMKSKGLTDVDDDGAKGTDERKNNDNPTTAPSSRDLAVVSIDEAAMEESLRALRYGGELRLWEAVRQIALTCDNRLLHMMKTDFHLVTHLEALKKFMLLGQGDFVTALMDLVGLELRKRASQLFRHNLNGMLDAALRSCTFSGQAEASVVLDRVGVRLLESSPGDVGWDIFSLDYMVDAPLTAVVHADSLSKYRVAFHMLWRLQRVQWSLSAGWKLLMCFNHTRGTEMLPRLKPILHRCTLHRARMTHVVNNLCAYLMFEVVESAWRALEDAITRATCLDDIIQAHNLYLSQIHERALLTSQHEALNLQLQQMLQSILRFCALEEALVTDALSVLARRRESKKKADARSAAG